MGLASFNRMRREQAEREKAALEQVVTAEEVKEAPKKPRSRAKAKEGEANAKADE